MYLFSKQTDQQILSCQFYVENQYPFVLLVNLNSGNGIVREYLAKCILKGVIEQGITRKIRFVLPVVVTSQYNTDNVFADIMNISFDSGKYYGSIVRILRQINTTDGNK